jgi:hypothetical protein
MAVPKRQDIRSFKSILVDRDPAIAKIAIRARSLVLDVLPDAYEIVWTVQKNVGYRTGPKKQTEHFCWISPAGKHVTLGFNYGTELPDPGKLLEGTGTKFRHVKLASIADVERPAVRALLEVAKSHRVPPVR